MAEAAVDFAKTLANVSVRLCDPYTFVPPYDASAEAAAAAAARSDSAGQGSDALLEEASEVRRAIGTMIEDLRTTEGQGEGGRRLAPSRWFIFGGGEGRRCGSGVATSGRGGTGHGDGGRWRGGAGAWWQEKWAFCSGYLEAWQSRSGEDGGAALGGGARGGGGGDFRNATVASA